MGAPRIKHIFWGKCSCLLIRLDCPHIFLIFQTYLFWFYMYEFYLNVCLCTMYMQCSQRPEEGVIFPESGAIDGSEPPCGDWEPSPCPLKENKYLSTHFSSPYCFLNAKHSPLLGLLQECRTIGLQQLFTALLKWFLEALGEPPPISSLETDLVGVKLI